ncbi:MAG: pilus assembly protein TadG-related protein [Dermatophilaceae bacterium]
MRRLSRAPFAAIRLRERGAVSAIFAFLLAGGVVMGMLAMTIDVGGIWLERRELQNGADAASMALADICARDATKCDPTQTPSTLDPLLDANAGKDHASQLDTRSGTVKGQCAREPGSTNFPGMPECESASTTAAITDLTKCPPLPTWLKNAAGMPYVETYSRTETASGSTILPKYFSELLVGGGADASVTACARAAWGVPGSYTSTVPITFSACEWKKQTAGGTNYVSEGPTGAKPGYGPGQSTWPAPSRETVITLHDPNDESNDCMWNGKDTAGGFGWVDASNCVAQVTSGGWAQIDTGNNVPQSCKDKLPGLVGTVIALPVFDCLVASHGTPSGAPPTTPGACDPTQRDSSGNNTYYHIAGWAKFYLSGYKLSGQGQSSILPGGQTSCPAGGGSRCLFGWFLKGSLDPDSGSIVPPGGTNDFGTYQVLPAG